MGALDLHRVAICMGKVLKLLSNLQPYAVNGDMVYQHKEDFCVVAYMCRVGILDRIEQNTYMQNSMVPIRIPTGVFSSRKETMASALSITIGKLKEMVDVDVVTANCVDEILDKKGCFFMYDEIVPQNVKESL